MSKKKTGFLSVMAALALAIFTIAAVPAAAGPLDNTKWLADLGPQGYSGISLLEFDAAGNATGNFGIQRGLVFTYTFNQTTNQGNLYETRTKYNWDFELRGGNNLYFANGMHPYGKYGVPQNFRQIEFQTSATLRDISNTLWLGMTNRGETLLDNITYDPDDEAGELDCTTGPAAPITDLEFEYTYNGSGGTGTVTTLGPFTTYNNTATMVFSNFMDIGPAATFRLFRYIP